MIKIVNRMSESEFVNAINSNIEELASRWGCSKLSFRSLSAGVSSGEMVTNLGMNLRVNDLKDGMAADKMVEVVNHSFQKSDVRRFQDFHIPDIVKPGQEPSAIVTEDGERLDLFGGQFYTFTTDGFNFASPASLVFENPQGYRFTCYNFFKANGKFYCTTSSELNNQPEGFLIWEEKTGNVWGETDTPKVFTNPRNFYPYDGGVNWNLGNSFILQKDGEWYAFLEMAGSSEHSGYAIYLAKCPTIDGRYTLVHSSPVLVNPERDLTIAANSVGNPEIAMFCAGQPYFSHGRYYMMYHYMVHDYNESYSYLYRAYSYNLADWVVDGVMMTGRLAPDRPKWTNADACWCEFKGRSYLFYTRNANQYLDPSVTAEDSINCLIDNRPLFELLNLPQ